VQHDPFSVHNVSPIAAQGGVTPLSPPTRHSSARAARSAAASRTHSPGALEALHSAERVLELSVTPWHRGDTSAHVLAVTSSPRRRSPTRAVTPSVHAAVAAARQLLCSLAGDAAAEYHPPSGTCLQLLRDKSRLLASQCVQLVAALVQAEQDAVVAMSEPQLKAAQPPPLPRSACRGRVAFAIVCQWEDVMCRAALCCAVLRCAALCCSEWLPGSRVRRCHNA
jgi:hypothetical protein